MTTTSVELPRNWRGWCKKAKLRPYEPSKKQYRWFYLKGRNHVWRVNCQGMFQCGDTISDFNRWALCEITEAPMPTNQQQFILTVEILLKQKEKSMTTPTEQAALPNNISIANLTEEQKTQFLAQFPAEMLKAVANDKEKSKAQLIAEKEMLLTELEAELIPKHAKTYLQWVAEGKKIKAEMFSDIKTIMDLDYEITEFKDKEVLESLKKKQRRTFKKYDGYQICVGRRAKDSFNNDARKGLAKIREYINSKHVDPGVTAVFNSLIEKNNNDNLSTSAVLALENCLYSESNPDGVNDESFAEGIRLLKKSWSQELTCFFAEVGQEDEQGKMNFESGSFSSFTLPPELKFNYFSVIKTKK